MAAYAHIRHIELDKIGNGKKRISRPSGDTSDMFGSSPTSTNASSPATTPRQVKNHMASSIFNTGGEVQPVKASRARVRPEGDSFNRLFGAKEVGDVIDTPKKNHQKSNIIFEQGGKVNGHATGVIGAIGAVAIGEPMANGISPNKTNGHATNGIIEHSATNGHYHGGSGSTGSLSGPSSGSSTPNGSINGDYKSNGNSNGGAMPTTPSRRIPPGGYSTKLW